MNINRRIGVITALILATFLLPLGLEANEEADHKVRYRKDLMKATAAHMGTLGCYMKGKCQLPPKVLKRAAHGIALMGRLSIPAYKSPTPGATVKTTSNAKVWAEWNQFEKGLNTMVERAQALKRAAASGERGQMGPAMGMLGKTCKGCHETFRDKKK
ncbi:MAG: cytochrome c [Magnetococcales bacterium]|nr:cytochrome c [Magnetococcales bacterium]